MPSTTFFLLFAALFASGYAIQCYICHSDDFPSCGNPFEAEDAKVGGLLKNCNARDVPHAVYKDPNTGRDVLARYSFCTKTTQMEVHDGSEREIVIRGCGFRNNTNLMPEDDEDKNALKCEETESPQGNLLYCACYGDGGCNPAGRIEIGTSIILFAGTMIGIAKIFQ